MRMRIIGPGAKVPAPGLVMFLSAGEVAAGSPCRGPVVLRTPGHYTGVCVTGHHFAASAYYAGYVAGLRAGLGASPCCPAVGGPMAYPAYHAYPAYARPCGCVCYPARRPVHYRGHTETVGRSYTITIRVR